MLNFPCTYCAFHNNQCPIIIKQLICCNSIINRVKRTSYLVYCVLFGANWTFNGELYNLDQKKLHHLTLKVEYKVY